jgi:hypothetical protein
VEFVHPVIVGKRALPAFHVDEPDLLGALRVGSRAADILLAVGAAHDERLAELMRHARAWGLLSLWIGTGLERPQSGAADHVIWLSDDEIGAAYGGGFVRAYHLLWELTHVCFEHPGLLTSESRECEDEVCITCSDEGRLGEVTAILPGNRASVRTAQGIESVDVTLIDSLRPGALVIIHAGSALALVEEVPR